MSYAGQRVFVVEKTVALIIKHFKAQESFFRFGCFDGLLRQRVV